MNNHFVAYRPSMPLPDGLGERVIVPDLDAAYPFVPKPSVPLLEAKPRTGLEFMEQLPDTKNKARFIAFVEDNKNLVLSDDSLKGHLLAKSFGTDNQIARFVIKNLRPVLNHTTFHAMKIGRGNDFVKSIVGEIADLYQPSGGANREVDVEVFELIYHTSKEDRFSKLWDLVNAIAKDIPMEQIHFTSDQSFREEMEDCFVQSEPVDLSQLDPKKTLIGQNGCRAVILTDAGDVYSHPGQDAAKLAQKMMNGADIDSFTIYHNAGHASIAFSDGHFGFYPNQRKDGAEEVAALQEEAKRAQWLLQGTGAGMKTGKEFGYSSITNLNKGTTALKVPIKIWHSWKWNSHLPPPVRCTVIDDSQEKQASAEANGLALTFYAPKEVVHAVREYVTKIQKDCASGNASYVGLSNNCIDFVRQAVQASGIKVDFRDSFHTMQYFRRPGMANFYTMFRSNQPNLIQPTNSSFSMSPARVVDRVPRFVVQGLPSLLAIPYAYVIRKGIPHAINGLSRASSRIQRFAVWGIGFMGAIGVGLRARLP